MQYTNMQLHIEMIEKCKHKTSNVLDYTDTSFQVNVKGYRACQKISRNASFLSFEAHLVNDNIRFRLIFLGIVVKECILGMSSTCLLTLYIGKHVANWLMTSHRI